MTGERVKNKQQEERMDETNPKKKLTEMNMPKNKTTKVGKTKDKTLNRKTIIKNRKGKQKRN